MVNVLAIGFRADGGYSDGRVSGELSGGHGLVYAPGGVSNGKYTSNIGENPLGGVLGADSGMRI